MKKYPTTKDIAKLAGVSRTTVSFVLNNRTDVKISEGTRQKVLDIAKELDYHPHAIATSLVKNKTKTIGLILCQQLGSVFSDAFLPRVILGVSTVAQKRGYKILLQYVEEVTKKDTYYHMVRENRIDGIILSGPRSDDEELHKLKDEDFPIVLMGQINDDSFSCSDINNVKAAKKAVQHLISHGHERIAIITNAPLNYTASELRLLGYKKALQENSITYDEKLVGIGNFTPQSGFDAMQKLLSIKKLPTAVFVASDVVAFGVIDAIKKSGMNIPEDIALVGFDNVNLSEYVDPPLTTVNLPGFDIGKNAANLLINIIKNNENKDKKIILETHMVLRKSCGCNL
jgi:LacI family transcriptional regulator